MSTTARALAFVAPRKVEIVDVALPNLKPGQVLIRTEYSGISGGTEMLAYRGEIDSSNPLDETIGSLAGTFEYPFSYGYSAVGREAEGGGPSTGGPLFAFHAHQDMFVVDESDLVPLDDVDPRTATLFPLVETALQVTLDVGARLDDHVVVVGLGAVGILTSLLLARSGARVLGSETQIGRRKIAESLGVQALDPDELKDVVDEITRGRGADYVVESSGNPEALGESLDLLRHEGTAVVCSWYGTKPVNLPLGGNFHRRRLTIRSSQVSSIPSNLQSGWDKPRRREATRRLMRELPLEAIATHEFPFEQAAEAYATIDSGAEGLVHVALRY
jgi:2-desacetyl-2-hydroxyethyl bacteriochlorophyllide A dehydrogenase